MVRRLHLQGYENFLKYVDDLETAESVYILYTGTKLADTGKSWCPDCVEGEWISREDAYITYICCVFRKYFDYWTNIRRQKREFIDISDI